MRPLFLTRLTIFLTNVDHRQKFRANPTTTDHPVTGGLLLARTGPSVMSAVRSLAGVNRTWHGRPGLVANDPLGHDAS